MHCSVNVKCVAIVVLSLLALTLPARLVQAIEPIPFTEEILDNGLHVIYAPLHQAPVVHVRVLYHVGSRDERPDRQGFAHMFEHMMFRGSAHVKPQEHMKLIGMVGGYSNAFTSFDQTVYINTLPSEHLEMALYLEADRMSSFKVSDDIYKTERKVVAEEWGMKNNKPYGNLYDDFLKVSFTTHSYRWTPIGNMDDLRAAAASELQDFYNTYYLPNNATLVIAGDFDPAQAKEMVHKYFGWIPRGPDVKRDIPQEPEQTDARAVTVPEFVPLPAVLIGYHVPAYRSDDHYALAVLEQVLSAGDSGRLDQLLVNNAEPMCTNVGAEHMQLEDAGIFGIEGTVMQGKDPKAVEKVIADAIADIVAKGITPEELEKAKTQLRVEIVKERDTADKIAEQLGEESVFGGDANRVNTDLQKIDALTPADIQAVAGKYLLPQRATTLLIQPDPTGIASRRAAAAAVLETKNAGVTPSTNPVVGRQITFPDGYPTTAPMAEVRSKASFAKGVESEVDGVKVIVMPDARLPLVNFRLVMQGGSDSEPKGKEGLAAMTAELLRHGSGDLSYEQLSEDLDSRGIELGASNWGDHTRLEGSCTTEQLDHLMLRAKEVLRSPTFPVDEFGKLQEQTVNNLTLDQDTPSTVAEHELQAAMWAGSPIGRYSTPQSVAAITIDDVKQFYKDFYQPQDAILIFSGDITPERGQALAKDLLDGWTGHAPLVANYDAAPLPAQRKIILVDRPESKQSVVRMGKRAYDLHSDEKFAGSLATQILTAGIDSRLGEYVRAKKGLAYAVEGYFSPGRHGGSFDGGTDTVVPSTGDAIDAMFKVFNDMRTEDVTPTELQQAKLRVAGSMVMGMQTIQQQASYRIDGILNGYPIDYYDNYPAQVAKVNADQILDVMKKYADDQALVIVVVGPADVLKPQLEKFGDVEVLPMPAKRGNAASQPAAPELLHSTQ